MNAPVQKTETANGHIELRLQDINQLFNSMDPSPFREKELDVEAEEFIVDWAAELPQARQMTLTIHVQNAANADINEQAVTEAVRNHFNYRTERIEWQSRQLLKQGWKDLGIGLAFLASCLTAAQLIGQLSSNTLITILRESLIIGGWVAMWRPMEYFLYGRWPVKRKQQLYKRLSNLDVELKTPD